MKRTIFLLGALLSLAFFVYTGPFFVVEIQEAHAFGHPDSTALQAAFVSPDAGEPLKPGFTVKYQISDTTPDDVGGKPQFVVLFTKNGDRDWMGRGGIQSFKEAFVQGGWCNMEGTNTCGVRIRASDTKGHITQMERFFTIDTTPPQITISSNRSDPTQKIDAEFRFSASDEYGIDLIECGLNGGLEPCVSPKGYDGIFPDGFHRFRVRAFDKAGNSAEKTLTWRIDSTPPTTIPNLATADPTYFSDNLSWNAPTEYDAVENENIASSQYDIRYSVAPITEDHWNDATSIIFGEPGSPGSPKPPGGGESMQIGPENDNARQILRVGSNNYEVSFKNLKLGDLSNILSANIKHYFAVRSRDADWNWSRISNIPTPWTERDPCDYDGDRLYSTKSACGPRVCEGAEQSCDLYDNPFEWALPDEPNPYNWSQAPGFWPFTKLEDFWIKAFGATSRDLDQDDEEVAEGRIGINLISQKNVGGYSSPEGKDWYDNPFTADLFSLTVKPTIKQLSDTINDLDLDTFVSQAWQEKFDSSRSSEPVDEAELKILSGGNISGLIYPGARESTCFDCTAYNPDPATGRIPPGKTKATTNKDRAVGQIEAYYSNLPIGNYDVIEQGTIDPGASVRAASAQCRDGLNNDLKSGTDSSEDPKDSTREINCPTKFEIETGTVSQSVPLRPSSDGATEGKRASSLRAAIFPDVGLVQCGRHADDYRTPIDESADCNLCHLSYLIFSLINLLISRLMPLIVAVSFVAGGFLMFIARGAPERFAKGKKVMMWSISAYGAVLLAWLLISIFFALIGVTKWTGLTPERGTVPATALTQTSLVDNSKTWEANYWVGYFIEVKNKDNENELAIIKIESNTEDSLELTDALPFAPSTNSEYKYHILNTGWWSFVCGLGQRAIADFSASPDSGIAPFSVDFTDLSLSSLRTIESWSWDFNGDGQEDSAQQSPRHTYTTNGPHTVTLTVRVEDAIGKKTKTVHYAPTANFTSDKTHGRSPLTVQFSDESTGEIDKWSWDFNGDNQEDSVSQNSSFTYTKPGPYRVKLTVSGPGGRDVESKLNYIFVYPEPLDPLAGFTTSTIAGTLTATTTNLSFDIIKYATIAFDATLASYNYCSIPDISQVIDDDDDGVMGADDCDNNNRHVFQNKNVIKDADQDGYAPSGANASMQCVGSSITVGAREYYNDRSNGHSWLLATDALGSEDCNDDPNTGGRLMFQSTIGYADADGDGYTLAGTSLCVGDTLPPPYLSSANPLDCDDDPVAPACGADCYPGNPATTLTPDNKDQDCDGEVDERIPGTSGLQKTCRNQSYPKPSAVEAACNSFCGGSGSYSCDRYEVTPGNGYSGYSFESCSTSGGGEGYVGICRIGPPDAQHPVTTSASCVCPDTPDRYQ